VVNATTAGVLPRHRSCHPRHCSSSHRARRGSDTHPARRELRVIDPHLLDDIICNGKLDQWAYHHGYNADMIGKYPVVKMSKKLIGLRENLQKTMVFAHICFGGLYPLSSVDP